MEFSYEEHASYHYSISNLATLKAFHDIGVDVSSFSNYMVDVNYSSSNGSEIFKDGCSQLFPLLKTYSNFEDDEDAKYLKQLKEENGLAWVPEYMYEFTNEPIQHLYQSTFKEQLVDIIRKSNNEVFDSHCDCEIVPLPQGAFGIAFYSLGQFHELAQAVILIYQESNRLFKQLKGE